MDTLARLRAWFAGLKPYVADKLRASPLLVVFLIAFTITVWLNPAKVGLTVWGIAKICLGAYLGYWADRAGFPYARPHTLTGVSAGTSWKRRAALMVGGMIAMALTP